MNRLIINKSNKYLNRVVRRAFFLHFLHLFDLKIPLAVLTCVKNRLYYISVPPFYADLALCLTSTRNYFIGLT